MQKPEDIPEGVWEAALQVSENINPVTILHGIVTIGAARAIIAERERCARIADAVATDRCAPAGYRLVPEEPTGEWLSRARHWVDRYAAGIDDKPQLDRIYSELPSAPAQQQEGGGK